MGLIDAPAHRHPGSFHLGPLVGALPAEGGEQHHPALAGKEEREALGRPPEIESQLEQPLAERPGVRHPKGGTALCQAVEVERRGGMGNQDAADLRVREANPRIANTSDAPQAGRPEPG